MSIGVKSGKIACLGIDLPISTGTQVIDAEGAFVTPGGVDSHVHLAQDNAPTGDDWLTGTRSALAGGTTTVLAFASQKRTDESLVPVLEEYHRRSRGQSYTDYGFHFILTSPSQLILRDELPRMVRNEGISSVKLYMTYPAMKLGDGDMLQVMMRTRELGMTTMIHAENSDMIDMLATPAPFIRDRITELPCCRIVKHLTDHSHVTPKYHAVARPQLAEAEATYRAIALSTLTSTPILIVHMSSPRALAHARRAQSKSLLPVHAETCPHYLYLRSSKLDETINVSFDVHGQVQRSERDYWAGARHVCAPPLRHADSDLQGVWDAVTNGTVNVISSDHAPSLYNHPQGKMKPLLTNISDPASLVSPFSPPSFASIPNGLPGLETRLPLLFDAATNTSLPPSRRLSLPRFVALTSTNAAKIYGLAGKKGSIAPGYDADIVVWYPLHDARVKELLIRNDNLHHSIDYTPFEGFRVNNWPRYVFLRGKLKWDRDHGGLLGRPGDGEFLKRNQGEVLVGRVGKIDEVGVPEGMMPSERSAWMDDIDLEIHQSSRLDSAGTDASVS